ncbi:hypothetical protein MAR_016434, partial [Mya arenaria]
YQAGCFRKLNHKWLTENSWLRYSVSKDGIYCGPCYLFGNSEEKVKVLVSAPLTDWSNITKNIAGHKKSSSHASATEAADNFVAIMEGQKKDIMSTLSSSHIMLVEKNRQVLVSIVDAIVLCGQQNIALPTDGATLTAAFLGNLRALNIQLDKMRGQGYDGAANMSG